MEAEMRKMEDEELVKRARQNDLHAENLIFERYRHKVRSLSASYHIQGADPEDLVQEGMIGLFKALQSYDSSRGASFNTFAALCIERQIISAVKSASCQKHMVLNNSVSLAGPVGGDDETEYITLEENIGDGSDDPQEKLLINEDFRLIEKNGSRLFSDMEREAWNMYIEGRSYREIAEKMNITSKAVDNAIRRAKKKLSDVLEEQ